MALNNIAGTAKLKRTITVVFEDGGSWSETTTDVACISLIASGVTDPGGTTISFS